MRVRHFEWAGGGDDAAAEIARQARAWAGETAPPIDLSEIEAAVAERGDAALVELTARFDATELRQADGGALGDSDSAATASGWVGPDGEPWRPLVERERQQAALAEIDAELRQALELAIANVRAVAEAQVSREPIRVDLPQGQRVTMREVAVAAAGIYTRREEGRAIPQA